MPLSRVIKRGELISTIVGANEMPNEHINSTVAHLIVQGAKIGDRHRSGKVIAEECCRLRENYYETTGVLLAWNLRNKPPMPVAEIEKIVNDVYSTAYIEASQKTRKQLKEEALKKQLSVF